MPMRCSRLLVFLSGNKKRYSGFSLRTNIISIYIHKESHHDIFPADRDNTECGKSEKKELKLT